MVTNADGAEEVGAGEVEAVAEDTAVATGNNSLMVVNHGFRRPAVHNKANRPPNTHPHLTIRTPDGVVPIPVGT